MAKTPGAECLCGPRLAVWQQFGDFNVFHEEFDAQENQCHAIKTISCVGVIVPWAIMIINYSE